MEAIHIQTATGPVFTCEAQEDSQIFVFVGRLLLGLALCLGRTHFRSDKTGARITAQKLAQGHTRRGKCQLDSSKV